MIEKKVRNVFFVVPSIGAGGAERVISFLANELVSKNVNVGIIVFNNIPRAYAISPKVMILQVGKNVIGNSKINKIRRIIDMHIIFKKYNNAIVNVFHDTCLKYVVLSARGTKVKVVACERNDPNSMYKSESSKENIRQLYSKSDASVFQTVEAKDFFCLHSDKKTSVIPNPVQKPAITWNHKDENHIIITACRLTAQKNLHMAIDAVEEVKEKYYNDIEFRIFGEGELESELKQYVCEKRLENTIKFMGVTKQVLDEFCKAEIFVLSSDYEGISNSMLEALSIGMPVICTDCPIGGARLMIENKFNGILIPVKDSHTLAENIALLLDDPLLAKQLGNNAKEIVEKCSISNITEKWMRLWKQL